MYDFANLDLAGRKILVAASTGGHLAQAIKLVEQVQPHRDSVIATFDSPQSERIALDYRVEYVNYIPPRGVAPAIRAAIAFRQLLSRERFYAVVSTGAGIALSAIPIAPRGVRRIYIESFSRFDGPSLTGKAMQFVPRVARFTQHQSWASDRWRFSGDLMPVSDVHSRYELTEDFAKTVFVTLGTIKPYRFDALVDAITNVAPPGCRIVWQLGCTTRDDINAEKYDLVKSSEFDRFAREADIVISHGGVATATALVEMGKQTILVPRRSSRGEHVDDHQEQICRELAERPTVEYREVDSLMTTDFRLIAPVHGPRQND